MLYPTFDVPELASETPRYDTAYKRSVAWDFSAGDFVRDGSNRLVECDGYDAYKTWCAKAVCTERYTCLAYGEEIGTELDAAMKEPVDGAVESAITRTITEALMVNPRTEYVRDFSFQRNSDKILCRFTVKGLEIDEFPVAILLDES